jgi:hypothetical protein
MKKFRFQLLHEWIAGRFKPCRVADIGGGKGMLAFLLDASGFTTTVIDPDPQPLPPKYKDLEGKRHLIPATARIRRVTKSFAVPMAQHYDLLVGLHAHGSNMMILEAARRHGAGAILLPCCVIGEPIVVRPRVDWFESLVEHARGLGLKIERFELNFRGQNHGFYAARDPAPLLESGPK